MYDYDPMNRSTPGLPVHHQLPEFTQTHIQSSQWCHPAISSSVVPFSSCPQSLSASESFPMSQPFPWGGQSTGVSALASVLPMSTQDWAPLGWTGWISLKSRGLSGVFSNTTVQKHQFFCAQLSSREAQIRRRRGRGHRKRERKISRQRELKWSRVRGKGHTA